MLDAEHWIEDANDSHLPRSPAMNAAHGPVRQADVAVQPHRATRSTYERGRASDSIATIGALLLTLGMIGTFAFMNPHVAPKLKREPTVVTMLPLPTDPPPAPADQPPAPPTQTPPPTAQIAAPAPVITLADRQVIMAPAIVQPVAVPAPPAPPAPVAPSAPGAPENMGDLSARMISAKPPRFPIEARRAHEEGVVVLSVLLATDGRVADISIASSSGSPRLDRAALEAVREWRWSPLLKDGQAMMVRGVVTIPFILKRAGQGDDARSSRGGRRVATDANQNI